MNRAFIVSVSLLSTALVAAAACDDDAQDGAVATGTATATTTTTGTGGAGGGHFALDFEEIDLAGDPLYVTDFAFVPGAPGEFLATQKDGTVLHYLMPEAAGEPATLLGFFDLAETFDDLDCGLISLAFDPAFAENGLLYLGTCVSEDESTIFRMTFDPSDYVATGNSAANIITVGTVAATVPWHNVGSIGFDADGYLWAIFGEKATKDPAQDLATNLGKLVRIDPNREPGGSGYEPAPDNPFASDPGASPDVWALGLRSPWKGTFDDSGAGPRWFVGDVGSNKFEEVNLVREPGQNFGWPDVEGPCQADCGDVSDPVLSWPRSSDYAYVGADAEAVPTNGRVVWVGPVVRETEGDRYGGGLAGKLLFGDFCVGFVRGAEVDGEGTVTSDVFLGHLPHASAWRQAEDGYVYAMTFGRCQTDVQSGSDDDRSRMYRAVPAP